MKKIVIALLLTMVGSLLYAREGIEKVMEISQHGLLVQQLKMQIIAENIANAQTTRTGEGGPYRRKDVIVRETGDSVAVDKIADDNSPFIKIFDPGHPDADKEGFVYYPNVNMTQEMTNMAYSSKLYEAQIVVFNTAKNMAQSIMNLGK